MAPTYSRWSASHPAASNASARIGHAVGWGGFYGVSADALYDACSKAGLALLAFELGTNATCAMCEHNMWFVQADCAPTASLSSTSPLTAVGLPTACAPPPADFYARVGTRALQYYKQRARHHQTGR